MGIVTLRLSIKWLIAEKVRTSLGLWRKIGGVSERDKEIETFFVSLAKPRSSIPCWGSFFLILPLVKSAACYGLFVFVLFILVFEGKETI